MVWFFILVLSVYKVYSSAENVEHELPKPPLIKPPRKLPELVPFGHIFKHGLDDPGADFKVPYDMLELSLRYPVSDQEKAKLLKEAPKNRILHFDFKEDRSKQFLSPRDAYLHDLTILKEKEPTRPPYEPQWFNFEKIHQFNVEMFRPPIVASTSPSPELTAADTKRYFSRTSFDFVPHFNEAKLNWTSCKEFGKEVTPKNAFHPRDIVDMNWEPFYVWALRQNIAFTIHRFSYPSKKIVRQYIQEYGRYLGKSLDWEQPKLLLKEQIEMLLLAADRTGLFYGIPKQRLPLSIRNTNITLPVVTLRLRIEDPYLSLMYCDDYYAVIMAGPGNCPETKEEKEKEAAILKFRGEGYPIERNVELEKLLEAKIVGAEEITNEEEAPKLDTPEGGHLPPF